MDCNNHDLYTANSQFITHLTGRVLSELNIKSTPINTRYENLLGLVDCTNNDSFELFEGLYKNNPESFDVLKKFKSGLTNIIDKLENKTFNTIEESGTSKFSRLVTKYKNDDNLLNFTIGQPDYDPPKAIIPHLKNVIDNERIVYTQIEGNLKLRTEISNYLKSKELYYTTDEILCSNGAKQCIYQTLLYLIKSDEEVIIPAPYWTSYPSMVKLVGGKPIIYETKEKNNFQIKSYEIEKLITNKTKAIIICNPNNPTGVIYDKKILYEISLLVKKYNIYVISDEVYEMVDYFQKHIFLLL